MHAAGGSNNWSSQTNEDGTHFLYASRDDLSVPNPLEAESAYLFSAATGSSVCVSCPADGSAPQARPPAFELGMPAVVAGVRLGGSNVLPRSLSEDGRVLFNSEEVLAPGAVEGHGERVGTFLVSHPTQTNLYEWHQGQVALLATGAVEGIGIGGPLGRDVFLKSYEQLAGGDFDFNADVYDLRSGGGFAPPPSPLIPCDPAADQCQGAPSPAPGTSSAPSSTFAGPGNVASQPRKKKHRKKKRHRKKRQRAKGQHGKPGAKNIHRGRAK